MTRNSCAPPASPAAFGFRDALVGFLSLFPGFALWFFLLLRVFVPTPALADIYVDQPPKADWYRRPLLRLTAFAAGQSDCLLLECGGEAMMIDGGSAPYREALRDALTARGIASFKYLLNTHYHNDHIDGLYWLLRYGFPAGEYLHPYGDFAEAYDSLQARTLAQARRAGVPIRQVENGEALLLGEATLTLYRYDDSPTVNGRSMIQHIRFGDATLLLCADIIGLTQTWFSQQLPADVLQVDVMKAPHHGITPLSSPFLHATLPQVMLITNDEETARRAILQAEKFGMRIFCAAGDTTVLETDGEDWYIYQLPGFS